MPNLQAFERGDYQQVKADLHRKILDRLDHAHQPADLFALEGGEIRQILDAPALARDLVDLVHGRLALQHRQVQIEQAGEGGVEKTQPCIGAEDRHGGTQVFQQFVLGGDLAAELGLSPAELDGLRDAGVIA